MPTKPRRILRLPAVKYRTGLSRSCLDRMEQRGDFPRRIKLGMHAVGWLESEVSRWIAVRARTRRWGVQA